MMKMIFHTLLSLTLTTILATAANEFKVGFCFISVNMFRAGTHWCSNVPVRRTHTPLSPSARSSRLCPLWHKPQLRFAMHTNIHTRFSTVTRSSKTIPPPCHIHTLTTRTCLRISHGRMSMASRTRPNHSINIYLNTVVPVGLMVP